MSDGTPATRGGGLSESGFSGFRDFQDSAGAGVCGGIVRIRIFRIKGFTGFRRRGRLRGGLSESGFSGLKDFQDSEGARFLRESAGSVNEIPQILILTKMVRGKEFPVAEKNTSRAKQNPENPLILKILILTKRELGFPVAARNASRAKRNPENPLILKILILTKAERDSPTAKPFNPKNPDSDKTAQTP